MADGTANVADGLEESADTEGDEEPGAGADHLVGVQEGQEEEDGDEDGGSDEGRAVVVEDEVGVSVGHG